MGVLVGIPSCLIVLVRMAMLSNELDFLRVRNKYVQMSTPIRNKSDNKLLAPSVD